jgi:anti-sigma-K factor RskA
MTEHPWSELAPAYALGSLDSAERTEFERHLESCASCRAEVQSFREAAGLLSFGITAATPPPALRQRVLRAARRSRTRSIVPWLAAAATVLALLGGYGYWRSRSAELALQSALDSTRQVVAGILDSSVAIADLAATGRPPSMRLYWNRTRNIVVVAAFQLPPARAGRTYQLWAIKQGQAPVSLGTFDTPPSGRTVVTVAMPVGFRPDLSAVTEEPAGGSPQPTQEPFLVGNWPHVLTP